MATTARAREPLGYVSSLADTSVGPAGEQLKQIESRLCLAILRSEFFRRKFWLAQALSKTSQFRNLKQGWDSYGAQPPNATAIKNATEVISAIGLTSMPVPSILPSAEGGIGICFVAADRYADIECLNSGEILAVRYVGNQAPTVWELEPTTESINTSLEQIREHVGL